MLFRYERPVLRERDHSVDVEQTVAEVMTNYQQTTTTNAYTYIIHTCELLLNNYLKYATSSKSTVFLTFCVFLTFDTLTDLEIFCHLGLSLKTSPNVTSSHV